jgi:hypothetical protein
LDESSLPSSLAITQQLLTNVIDGAMGSTSQGTATGAARPEATGTVSEQTEPNESTPAEVTGLQVSFLVSSIPDAIQLKIVLKLGFINALNPKPKPDSSHKEGADNSRKHAIII